MESGFITVFDLAQTGYRNWHQVVVIILILAVAGIAIVFWARANKTETMFIKVLWVVFAVIFLIVIFFQISSYRQYLYLKAGRHMNAEIVSGHVVFLKPKEQFERFAIDDREFRYSAELMPYRLGMHRKDFSLRQGFLVKVTTVDNVIVRLQVHSVHL